MCVFFFFQAEDGIRDLVRSRGLGDVYKRQPKPLEALLASPTVGVEGLHEFVAILVNLMVGAGAVSYTHLTLPTSDLV